VRRWFFARTYPQVLLQIIIGLVPYGIGLAWALWTKRVWQIEGVEPAQQLDPVGMALIESYEDQP
jgi:hypothetical protein